MGSFGGCLLGVFFGVFGVFGFSFGLFWVLVLVVIVLCSKEIEIFSLFNS